MCGEPASVWEEYFQHSKWNKQSEHTSCLRARPMVPLTTSRPNQRLNVYHCFITGLRVTRKARVYLNSKICKITDWKRWLPASFHIKAAFLWRDPDQDQWSKICLDHGASEEPMNPWPEWTPWRYIYDKIQYSVIDIKSSKFYMHQSKGEWQLADSTNSYYANRYRAKRHRTERHHSKRHQA